MLFVITQGKSKAAPFFNWNTILRNYKEGCKSCVRYLTMMDDNRILIAGAGPVGYAAALNLAHYGIPFTLLEGDATILDDPRAGTIHPPTLEMFA